MEHAVPARELRFRIRVRHGARQGQGFLQRRGRLTIYLVLPSASPLGGELSDEELEAVSGGDDAGGGSLDTWSYC